MNDDDHDKLFTVKPPAGADGDVYTASTVAGQAPASLLDLVRSAEEEATVALGKPGPTSATKFHAAKATPADEDVVDVGDEAVDVAPSLPPNRTVATSEAPPPKSETIRRTGASPRAKIEAPDEAKSQPASAGAEGDDGDAKADAAETREATTARTAPPTRPKLAPEPAPASGGLPAGAGLVLLLVAVVAVLAGIMALPPLR